MLVLHDMVELRLVVRYCGRVNVCLERNRTSPTKCENDRGRLFHNREGRVEWDVVLL